MQRAGTVGADLYAGAEFTELRRLLVNIDVDAAADQGERRGQATDAAADDGDIAGHFRLPLTGQPGSPAALRLRSTKMSSSFGTT